MEERNNPLENSTPELDLKSTLTERNFGYMDAKKKKEQADAALAVYENAINACKKLEDGTLFTPEAANAPIEFPESDAAEIIRRYCTAKQASELWNVTQQFSGNRGMENRTKTCFHIEGKGYVLMEEYSGAADKATIFSESACAPPKPETPAPTTSVEPPVPPSTTATEKQPNKGKNRFIAFLDSFRS